MTLCMNDSMSTGRRVSELFENVEALEAGGIGALSAGGSNLPLRRLAIRSRVSGVACQTTIAQVFANPHREFVEATYIFPLPGRFAVTACTMHVGGRVIEAELQERSQARATYNQAIAAGHRASIAEEERSEVFTLRVGNIPPLEEVTVELTLVGNISVDHGEGTLRLPLVVAPRYVPGTPLDGPSVGLGIAPDTDEAPDASRISPPTLLAGFPNLVALSLEVDLEPGIAATESGWRNSIRSSLHSVFVSETTPVKIKLLPGERLNRDFILRFPVLPTAAAGVAEYATGKDQALGTFAVTIYPPAGCAKSALPRDVVFVLDRSGSMEGWKIVAARRALARMIDSLRETDRFRVLAFDYTIESPHANGSDFEIATDRQRYQAAEWIAKIDARGGTELGGALRAALQPFATFGMPADRDAVVVIITDGQVGGEDSVLRTIESLRLPRMPRIFTLGIDRSVNAGLLTRLANLGGGSFELIESEQRLDQVLQHVHEQIAPPVLTNIAIEPLDFDLIQSSLTPSSNCSVFADRPLTILGRCGQDPKSLRLRIVARDASGGIWQQEITAERTNSPLLLPLWGRSHVRELEDQYARNSDQTLQNKIVAVSLESHILSRFTSYVAVDRAEVVTKGGQQHQIVQPVEQPEGWLKPAAARPLHIKREVRRERALGTRSMAAPAPEDHDLDFLAELPDKLSSGEVGGIGESVKGFADSARKFFQSILPTGTGMRHFKAPADDSKDAKPAPAASAPGDTIPEHIIELIPESVVRENNVLPVAERDGKLVVRMSDPNDIDTVEKLRFILNKRIEVEQASAEEIAQGIDKHYPPGSGSDSILQEFCDRAIEFTDTAIDFTETASSSPIDIVVDENSAPVVRMVNLMIQEAVQLQATHIVLQPETEIVRIKYLYKKELHDRDAPPKRLHSAIISRLKILAKLDIAQRDALQIGTIKVTVGAIDLELCVVIIPTPLGQAVVMRLLRSKPTPVQSIWLELLAPWLRSPDLAAGDQRRVTALLCD